MSQDVVKIKSIYKQPHGQRLAGQYIAAGVNM